MKEAPFADSNFGLMSRMMKPVDTGFERAVSPHIKHLHGNHFARGLTGDVFPELSVSACLPSVRKIRCPRRGPFN